MIVYLIKSSICLLIVLCIYHLLLEREKMHVFNRYFLLFGLVFSFLTPLITVGYIAEIPLENNWMELIPVSDSELGASTVTAKKQFSFFNSFNWLLSIYWVVVSLLSVRLFIHLSKLTQKATRNKKVDFQNSQLVLVKEAVLPHTFLNYIFINEKAYENKNIEWELFAHELAHVRQRHSFDILLIEVLKIIFWFNPILIFYKQAIQLNHEFLADDAVIKKHQHIPAYQHLLLDKAAWNNKILLASNLNYSLTKKRLKMMTKKSSRWRTYLIASSTLPLFVGLLLLFGHKATAQETPDRTHPVKVQKIKDEYYKNATFVFPQENGLNVYKPYERMTDEEKRAIPPLPAANSDIQIKPLPEGSVVHLEKDGKVWIDTSGDNMPPPPPPLPSKAPKAPKAPKSMKVPKAPKAPKTPKAMKEPKPPKAPVAPVPSEPSLEPVPSAVPAPPAPPPPPPEPHIHLKELAEDGAVFYLNGKEIEAEKAIKTVKNTSNIKTIDVKKTEYSDKTVYITTKGAM